MTGGQQDNKRKKKAMGTAFALAMTVLFLAALLVGPQASAVTHYDNILGSSSAHLLSGTGSFSELSETNKIIYVRTGEMISGNVSLVTENNMITTDRAYLIGTTNWTSRESGYWTINQTIGTGVQIYSTGIAVTAPLNEGTFYLIFAYNAEYNAENVASCTNWRYSENNNGAVVWNDGNDVAGLTPTQLAQLQADGRTAVNYRFEFGLQSAWTLPGDAIKVIVQKYENITGRVTDPKGEPVAGVDVSLDSERNIATNESGQFSFEVVAGKSHVLTFSKSGFETRGYPLNETAFTDLGSLIIFPSPEPPPPPMPDWVPILFAITVGAAVISVLGLRRIRL